MLVSWLLKIIASLYWLCGRGVTNSGSAIRQGRLINSELPNVRRAMMLPQKKQLILSHESTGIPINGFFCW
jgi:hypothetical protein